MQESKETNQIPINKYLQSILAIAHESEQITGETLGDLENQGDKLRKLHQNLDNINQNQEKANQNLNVISGISGYVTNYFFTKPKEISESFGSIFKPALPTPKNNNHITSMAKNFNQIEKETENETDDEIDKLLDELANSVDRIKQSGLGINNELHLQQDTISQLSLHTDKTTTKMSKLNNRISRI